MNTLHCWQGRREDIDERFGYLSDEWNATWADDWKDGTCMLLKGHVGPHEFTDDDSILIRFVDGAAGERGTEGNR